MDLSFSQLRHMKSEEYQKMNRLAQTHCFFVWKQKLISSIIKNIDLYLKDARIFDEGCRTDDNHLFLKQFKKTR